MQFYRARSCGSVVAIEVIVEKLWTCAALEKLPQAKHAYGPVTPTSRFCSLFVFNAFGDVARRLWNGIRFFDWQSKVPSQIFALLSVGRIVKRIKSFDIKRLEML